jgi:uncharacterized protein DUF4115
MMSATVVLLALGWVGIGVVTAIRWLVADDRHTVEWHQHGLGALGGVTAHTGDRSPDEQPRPTAVGHVRLLSAAESSLVPTRPRRRSRTVVPPPRRRRRPNGSRQPRTPRAAAEVPPGHRVVISTPDADVVIDADDGDASPVVVERRPLPPIRPLDERRRRRRPNGWQVAIAAGAVAVAGLVAAQGRGVHPTRAQASPASQSRAATVETTTTSTIPTPPVAPLALTPVDGSPSELAVALAQPSVGLDIEATQPCWVEVRNGDREGVVLFSGIVDPGGPLQLTTSNPAWMRLGNPGGVTLSLEGTALTIPSDQPVDITLAPAPPAS